jgi:hypothetical protein
MTQIKKLVAQFKENPKNVKFNDLVKVCDCYFGDSRQSGSSHHLYKTPWQGDPRVNIQNKNGYGKPYQVKQVLAAISKIEEIKNG